MCSGKQVSGSLFSSPGSFATTLRAPSRQSWEPGLPGAARLNKVDRPDRTDRCRERRGKEREREGRLPVRTGSSREAERDCCVPLHLRRHSGCLERRGRRCACRLLPGSGRTVCVHSRAAGRILWTSVTSGASSRVTSRNS